MSKNTKIIVSFIILIIGILIFCSSYFKSKKIEVYDYINELYYNETITMEENIEEIVVEENEEDIVEDVEENNNSYQFEEVKINYIGYLNIPKINLNKGFTTIEDKYNVVSKNIQILSSSDYPDKENGNVIIAAHSGNSSVSFFNKLYLLSIGDQAYIEYKNNKYNYEIVDIYTVPKTGTIDIKRVINRSTLTLITCTKGDKTTQTVYTLVLSSIE